MHRLTRLALAASCFAMTATAVATAPAGAATKPKPKKPSEITVLLELTSSPALESFVQSVSDPSSKSYRQYRSIDWQVKHFGAKPKAKKATARWLQEHGLSGELGVTGTYYLVHTTKAKAAAAFDGATATTASAQSHGSTAAAIPAALKTDVASVTVSDNAPVLSPAAAPRQAPTTPGNLGSATTRTGTPAGCPAGQSAANDGTTFQGFTPNQYLSAYGHQTLHDRGLTGQGIRVAVVEIDGFNPGDVQAFATCFGHHVPPISAHPVGMKDLLPPADETTLDLEVLTAAAPDLTSIDVYEGGSSALQLLSTVAAAVSDDKRLPNVISVSLDSCEQDYYGEVAATRVISTMFALAAGAGISTLVATGDQGVTACKDMSGNAIPLLSATFPSTSPYVTAVGGTNITLDAANQITNQVVWNDAPAAFAGGSGGPSMMFDRPWYQSGAKGLSDSISHDVTRLTPDVAGLADIVPGYAVYCTAQPACATNNSPNGGWIAVGGTSAATPLMAAAVALADQAAVKRGEPTLGLINPLVYQLAGSPQYDKVLSDVVTGNNDTGTVIAAPVGNGQPLGCCSASKGYDPVTGWGSLKVAAFSDAALAFGDKTIRK